MTDTAQKIAEIREALEKATPGPWEYEMWEGCADVYPTTGRHVPICQLWTKTEEPMENAENNVHLIANAPEWLRFLIQAVEMYRELMHELDKENDHLHKKINELEKLKHERDRNDGENRKLREELSFREREAYGAFKYWFGAWQEVKKENGQLQDQLQSAQQEIERLQAELEDERRQHEFEKVQHDELRETVGKLIEVLRWYGDGSEDGGQRARDILREVGVTTDA